MRSVIFTGMVLAAFGAMGIEAHAQVEPANLPSPRTNSPTVLHHGWANVVDGRLIGRAVVITEDGGSEPLSGAVVTLLKETAELETTVADADGNFELQGLAAGSYGILVESSGAFAAHSFRTVNGDAIAPVEVYAGPMPRADVEAIWQSLWTPDAESVAGTSLGEFPEVFEQSPTVRLKNGKVLGRVVFENRTAVPARHFVKVYDKWGDLIATEQVKANGEFAVALPGPELYNFIVGGQAYACVCARVIDDMGIAKRPNDRPRLISEALPQEASDSLIISAIGPPPPAPLEEVPPAIAGPGGLPMFGSPAPFGGGGGGGFGGGGAGGFGGGGGLGGLGGLLGIAGLAAGVVALSDDDDGFTPPPATPIAN